MSKKKIMSRKFDIDLRCRGSYTSRFGKNYLLLKREYNVDGSILIKRVFEDAVKIVAFRKEREAEAMRKKQDAEAELRRLIAGEK